jgi:hypothetical protein
VSFRDDGLPRLLYEEAVPEVRIPKRQYWGAKLGLILETKSEKPRILLGEAVIEAYVELIDVIRRDGIVQEIVSYTRRTYAPR